MLVAEELTARAWSEDGTPTLAFRLDIWVVSLLEVVGEVVAGA